MIPIKKLLITSCLILGIAIPGFAQVTVSGTVTDATDGQTLPGVNVVVKGHPIMGTATDADGFYSISVPSTADTLIFSFVGYLKQEIPIRGRTQIDVSLSRNIQQLENVVVIGYGTQQIEDNTGAVTAVNAADFNEGAITSVGELFRGKAAGVIVTSNNGAPGSGATIRIRGGSSLSASNAPLYVVDGVPLSGSHIDGMRNPLNTINPSDIASITILKDASATAIYGSRASNGVILITTKEGSVGQPLSFTYTGKASYQTMVNQLDVLSADELRRVMENKFGASGVQYLGEASTDWQDQIYQNAFSQDHNLSVSGSIDKLKLPFRASLGFSGNSGILRTSQMNRLTGSIALNPSFFDDQLKVDINLRGMQVKNQFANKGAIGSAVRFDPTQPVMVDTTGAPFGGYYTWVNGSGQRIPIAPANPVALLDQTDDKSTVYRSIGNIKFDYALPFVSNLSAILNLGYDYSKVGNGLYLVPENAAFADNGTTASGTRREYDQTRENELLDFYLNYNKQLSSIESTLDFTAGYSWEHHYSQGSTYATNFDRADTTVVFQDTDYETEHYLLSFFGRLNYTFKDKYLLTATLRRDGTSRFSPESRWGLFPSAAFAWKIHKESFLDGVEGLTQLKLRLGYGITGQQRINQGDYPYLGLYTYGESTAQYQFGDEFVTTLRPEGYNANLKWEETTTYNIGLDYGILNDRIYGSIDAYYRETTDLLNVIPVAAGT
ncbi:MAG TPA: SusC/RagA family TonB-linked outer membrane protein, partial [Balneolaceae bacterium]|nr:SusC/RagA family TonB-linked outer membrane protein [Balneolaceae bacterium]